MRKHSLVLIRSCYTVANDLLVRNLVRANHVEKFKLSKVKQDGKSHRERSDQFLLAGFRLGEQNL